MGSAAGLFLYAGFLFFTLITAIISNFKNRLIPLAYITIIISLAVPLLHLLFSSGNTGDTVGTSYLFQKFQDRNLWAVLITFMHIYLAGWLVLFIYTLFGKRFIKWYQHIAGKAKKPEITVSERSMELKKLEIIDQERSKELEKPGEIVSERSKGAKKPGDIISKKIKEASKKLWHLAKEGLKRAKKQGIVVSGIIKKVSKRLWSLVTEGFRRAKKLGIIISKKIKEAKNPKSENEERKMRE